MQANTLELIALILFIVALIHTFSAKIFERLAYRYPNHAGAFHLLGEVEAVFGFWSMVLIVVMFFMVGKTEAINYLDSRNYTEPLFVFVIMVVAATKPVIVFTSACVRSLAKILPLPSTMAFYFLSLSVVPLIGSLITEPAAMTLAALMLRDQVYKQQISTKLMYATIGVLFVNISIGGTLTPYAAPPVLMVAATWGWDLSFMLTHFGWRSTIAVFVNALVITLLFSNQLKALKPQRLENSIHIPPSVVLVHLAFLLGVVVFAHHPPMFLGLFLFFMGYVTAYEHYQDPLVLREGLMVAFFLAGLVVLGGMQQWWLEPIISKLSPTALYFGATALTAITDNAALTYLGSLVSGLSPEAKYYLVAGAVTGGGLTVIANAPNPAGYTILKDYFPDQEIGPLGLLLAALGPTLIAIIAFMVLPGPH
ncbi:MAG: putative Na+/H+ antiporter [Burkholderiaceae bacterium]|nr:putative Na+/H+ antiporter [Burkholderiaceae bacterium]